MLAQCVIDYNAARRSVKDKLKNEMRCRRRFI